MVELVDTPVLGAGAFGIRVQVPSLAIGSRRVSAHCRVRLCDNGLLFLGIFSIFREVNMVEDKQFERLEDSAMKLTVRIDPGGVDKAYYELLEKYLKEAQIPGFRKGKIPRNVLVRKMGEELKEEVTGKLLDAALREALENEDANPISKPLLEKMSKLELGRPFTFSVTFDVFPDIDMAEYRGIEVEKLRAEISQKDVARELENIRMQNSIVMDKEDGIAARGSVVTTNYVELDYEGRALEQSRRKGFVFTLGKGHPYGLDDQIEGMRVGDMRVLEGSRDAVSVEVSVVAVKVREFPKLDDELARDISEELNSLDDLKKKLREDLEHRAELKIRVRKINKITDKLLEGTRIILPHSMIENDLKHTWQDYVLQSGVTEEVLIEALKNANQSKEGILNKWRKDAIKSIKTRLIYGRLAENEKIVVSDKEVDAELARRGKQQGLDTEEMEKRFGGKQFRDYLRSELLQEQLFDFLLRNSIEKRSQTIEYAELMGE